jgi:putative endonuclease
MDARQRLGRAAEQTAAAYLEGSGYRILARNVRVGRGELDIIARRGSTLVFVEVKARRGGGCGTPEEAVTFWKQRQVARLAALWLLSRPGLQRAVGEVRFDVVAVDLSVCPPGVRHLQAAFDGDG